VAAASGVAWYICARIVDCRALKCERGSPLSEMLGMSLPAPWKLSGSALVKAIGDTAGSTPARRARKPKSLPCGTSRLSQS